MRKSRASTVVFALWAGAATVALALTAAARWRTPAPAEAPIAPSTRSVTRVTPAASAPRERDNLSQWGLLGLISGRDPDLRPGIDRLEHVDTFPSEKDSVKKYEQRYRDIPVLGASVLVTEEATTRDIVRVSGQYFAAIDVDPKPRLTYEQAFSSWQKSRPTLTGYEIAKSSLAVAPSKLWPAFQGGRYFLVWQLRLEHREKSDHAHYPSYSALIDAHTGHVVSSQSSIRH